MKRLLGEQSSPSLSRLQHLYKTLTCMFAEILSWNNHISSKTLTFHRHGGEQIMTKFFLLSELNLLQVYWLFSNCFLAEILQKSQWQKWRRLLLTIQACTTVESTLLSQVLPATWSSQKPQPFSQNVSDQHTSLHNVLYFGLPGKHSGQHGGEKYL